ncbi:hypothetical protein GCM10029963_37920 [Micromonospora andamanensis]|uniref:hypothetical protein n=1 Tax=Micromonospora andamanensis TaxID=1287068 RepID=UPI00194DF721|nr:hypothetical protein [Micromonospora andamanensis]GIJ40702.1 hypothetical protein Vwe01_40270 [Micromonospora andamanensis]
MSPFLAIFLVLVLAATSYAAGRLHGQLSYRIGYRFGYRQGYFDGDRGAWNRRRRDAQAAIASALAVAAPSSPAARVTATVNPLPPRGASPAPSALRSDGPQGEIEKAGAARPGTTYTGSSFAEPAASVTGRHPTGTLVRRTG